MFTQKERAGRRRAASLLAAVLLVCLCALAPSAEAVSKEDSVKYICAVRDSEDNVVALAGMIKLKSGNALVISTIVEDQAEGFSVKGSNGTYSLKPYDLDFNSNIPLSAWTAEAAASDSAAMMLVTPARGERVSVAYYYRESDSLSFNLETHYPDPDNYKTEENGSGYYMLDGEVSGEFVPPGIVLTDKEECAGFLWYENVVYTPLFDEAVYTSKSSTDDPNPNPNPEPEPEPEPVPVPDVPGPNPNPTLLELIKENMALVLGGIFGGAGAVFAILYRKQQKKKEDEFKKITSKSGVTEVTYPPYQTTPAGPTAPLTPPPYTPPASPVQNGTNVTQPVHMPQNLYLMCRGGCYDGQRIPLNGPVITMGRDSSNTITFPDNYPGVSRKHAVLRIENGIMTLQDISSTGTFLKRIQGRLTPNQPIQVNVGDVFYLGEHKNRFEIVRM